jgi:replicative DNA helicase
MPWVRGLGGAIEALLREHGVRHAANRGLRPVGTGFRGIDHLAGCFGRRRLTVLAGADDPLLTSFCARVVANVASRRSSVLCLTPAIPTEKLARTMLAHESGMRCWLSPSAPPLGKRALRPLVAAWRDMRGWPLLVGDERIEGAGALRRALDDALPRFAVDLLLIDSLERIARRPGADAEAPDVAEALRCAKSVAVVRDFAALAVSRSPRWVLRPATEHGAEACELPLEAVATLADSLIFMPPEPACDPRLRPRRHELLVFRHDRDGPDRVWVPTDSAPRRT